MTLVQNKPLLDLLRTELQARLPAAHFAFIFGSRAQGREHPTSDLDLAVFCGRPLTPDERLEWSSALAHKFKMKVDLVDLMTCGPTVEFEIVQGGITFFEKSRQLC